MTPAEIKHWRELAAIHTSRFPVLQLLDALEKANAKCDRLRAALKPFSDVWNDDMNRKSCEGVAIWTRTNTDPDKVRRIMVSDLKTARDALAECGDEK